MAELALRRPPPALAFGHLDARTIRWVTQSPCPDCYAAAITAARTMYWAEILCPGCQQWESLAVPAAALDAYRQGHLTETQAFPDLNNTQRTLIECGWHPNCWDHAAHLRSNEMTTTPPP